MAADIGVYNFSWKDMGVPTLFKMMDIVQVKQFYLPDLQLQGNELVLCMCFASAYQCEARSDLLPVVPATEQSFHCACTACDCLHWIHSFLHECILPHIKHDALAQTLRHYFGTLMCPIWYNDMT